MDGSRGRTTDSVNVTRAARSYLASQLVHRAPEACFRLRPGSDWKSSVTLTKPSPGDLLVRHEGEVVLAIEQELASHLRGNTIDIENTDDGRRLLLVL